MMEKVYIATTTLNFNNILSTESISPEIFYLQRSFGYRRFDKVPPNPFSSILIAYSKLPRFEMGESDYDHYPLIIEISRDLIRDDMILNEDERNGIKVIQIYKTIYLHPNRTTFLFIAQDHLDITLTKAEPSIETKLVPAYKKKLKVIQGNEDSFQWNESYLQGIKDSINDLKEIRNREIERDAKIDKLKGFYFAYFLGALYPIMRAKRDIRKRIEKIEKEASELSNKTKNAGSLKKLKKIEKRKTKKRMKESERESYLLIKNLNFSDYQVTQLPRDSFRGNEAEMYKSVINDLIDYPVENGETFKAERARLVIRVGRRLEQYFPEWEKSPERHYLNSLLDNIENYQPFDIKSHPSLLMQSIALFAQTGEDVEKLIRFLERNEISDYRIALGLWGIVFGFAALPKTLTDTLFREDYRNITRKIYQDIQRKLHGNIPEGNIPEQVQKDKVPKCPICNADMQEREVRKGKHKGYKFWGCSRYPNCKGKRNEELIELNDDFEPVRVDNYVIAGWILECVKQKQHCKVKPDIIDYVYEKARNYTYREKDGDEIKLTKQKLTVKFIEDIITSYLKKELESEKIGRASAYKVRQQQVVLIDKSESDT